MVSRVTGAGRKSQKEMEPLPAGLYLVATPIGNLEDITLRALRVLRMATRLACEDTRLTQKLLHYFEIERSAVSYHQHNEASRGAELIEAIRNGESVALVSDAGTPAISDPGSHVVALAVAAGLLIVPIPGANAAIAALIASGLSTESFRYCGFLPSRTGERKSWLEELRAERETLIFYESPHRILDALTDMEAVLGGGRIMVAARELTKLHEEWIRGSIAEVRANFAAREVVRGEMTLVVAGGGVDSAGAVAGSAAVAAENSRTAAATVVDLATRMHQLIEQESLSEKDALKRVAKERGIGKSDAYREWQRHRRR